MHDIPFGISDDEMDDYLQRFNDGVGFNPSHIFFNGIPLHPVPGIRMEHTPPSRNLGLAIEDGRLTYSPIHKERIALRYLWQRLNSGRDYVSLNHMAKTLGLNYDDCDRLVAEAHVNKKITRMVIVEEVEG